MDANEHYTLWVCEDCYFAHHYGVTVTATVETADGGTLEAPVGPDESIQAYIDKGCTIRYYAGDSDSPAEREPLSRLHGDGVRRLADYTCANHDVEVVYDDDGDRTGDTTECPYCGRDGYEDGIDTFRAYHTCDGCGSTVGGYRYRLALFPEV